MMQIIGRRKKIRIRRTDFVKLCKTVFLEGLFITEDVEICQQLISGESIYDSRITGKMVPHNEFTPQAEPEVLRGAEQVMSYFCDKYGIIKGFILGELFFRRKGSKEELEAYADILYRMHTRNSKARAGFYRWFIANCL